MVDRPTLDDFAMPAARCPACNRLATHALETRPNGGAPIAGDLTVCISCRAVLEFTAAPGLRRLTPDELRALPDETRRELARTRFALGATRPCALLSLAAVAGDFQSCPRCGFDYVGPPGPPTLCGACGPATEARS